jgi:hypothetical protein
VISSLADLFGSESGASMDFALYEEFLRGFLATGGKRIVISEPATDEFAAVTYKQGLAPNTVTYYVVAWRTGDVTASLNVNGFKLTWEQVVELMNKQDERIRAAQ